MARVVKSGLMCLWPHCFFLLFFPSRNSAEMIAETFPNLLGEVVSLPAHSHSLTHSLPLSLHTQTHSISSMSGIYLVLLNLPLCVGRPRGCD